MPSGSLRFASIQWLRGSRGGGLSTARTRSRSSRGELFEDCSDFIFDCCLVAPRQVRQSLRHAAWQREQPGAHYPKDIGPSPLDFLDNYELAAKLSIL